MKNEANIDVVPYKLVSFNCPCCKEFQMLPYHNFVNKLKKSNLTYWLDWYHKEFYCAKCKEKLVIGKIDW